MCVLFSDWMSSATARKRRRHASQGRSIDPSIDRGNGSTNRSMGSIDCRGRRRRRRIRRNHGWGWRSSESERRGGRQQLQAARRRIASRNGLNNVKQQAHEHMARFCCCWFLFVLIPIDALDPATHRDRQPKQQCRSSIWRPPRASAPSLRPQVCVYP